MALLTAAPAGATLPGLDGKILFVSDRDGNQEIYSMNADGTGQTRLTSNAATDTSAVWSPDGTKIAFQSNRAGVEEIYVMNADGSSPVDRTNDPSADLMPSWSPDGSKIAFTSTRSGNLEVWVMNAADGSNPTQLTSNPGTGSWLPAWSPDGSKIAFSSFRDGNEEIYVMNSDGSAETRRTFNSGSSDTDPAWSPDGTQVFYTSGTGNTDIFVEGTRLTTTSSNDISATPAPDFNKVAFGTDRDGNAEIYVMNPDGTSQTRVTINAGSDYPTDWFALPATMRSASSFSVPLVPVYRQCGIGGNPVNATHGPPALDGSATDGSCTAIAFTGTARVGPVSSGSASITVTPGNFTTAANEADDRFQVSINDVRTAAGADYTPVAAGPDMTLVQRLRVTDSYNCSPTPCSSTFDKRATLVDLDFSVPVDCVATTGSFGSNCSVNTTANTLLPNSVKEGRQDVIAVFRVRLVDSGPDNIRGNSDDKLFAQQGIFNP